MTAWSRQIQIQFTARVETVAGSPFGMGNVRGKIVTGSFWYETLTTDSDLTPVRGLYKHSLPFSGFSATLDNSNFSGSRIPHVQVENIANIDTFRYFDGADTANPGRIISMDGVALPTASLALAISSDKNPLNADRLPDPFPFKASDPHTFSLGDKNGTMLLQFQTLTDSAPVAPGLVSVTVRLTDKRARFLVDGGLYTDSKVFQWPRGTVHTLEFPVSEDGRQYSQALTSRWAFGGWQESSGLIESNGRFMSIIANPDLEIVGSVGGFQHQLTVNFFGDLIDMTKSGQTASPACQPGDTSVLSSLRSASLVMDGQCYWQSYNTWVSQGGHTFVVYPYPGFAFLGWLGGGVNVPEQVKTFQVLNPMVIEARLTPARRVRFATDPAGMAVKVNDVTLIPEPDVCRPLPVITPATIKQPCVGEFDFAPESEHTIGAPSPQRDRYGTAYLFDGFSNGMGNGSKYRVGPVTFNDNFDTLVAKFVVGVNSAIISQPVGVPLTVNGKTAIEQYNVFKPGEKIVISAPERATVGGRTFVFKGWSNGGPREQTATIPEDAGLSFNMTAEYSVDSQLVITSATPDTSVLVDGQACTLPCSVNGAPGREVRIEPNPQGSVSPVQRVQFVRWSDGGPTARIETLAGLNSRRIEAVFSTSYLLSVRTDPGDGANFTVTPASADNFYPEGTTVSIKATIRGGFAFNRWAGDASGAQPVAELTMGYARSAVALLDRVPYLAPNPVRNAATGVAGAVAPGSTVKIVGESLAFEFVQGPDNPLSQSIYGTSVAVDHYRYLPLKFVSPQEIQAVLPVDLTAGEHTITVRRSGYDDVLSKFQVSAAAPGLFTTGEPNSNLVLGYRADGSQISMSNSAHPGETVTLLATGLGTYQMQPVEGAALPAAPPYLLTNAVDVYLAASKVKEAFASGRAGAVGVAEVRFTIPASAPEGTLDVQLKMEGAESPAVLLPVTPAPSK